MFPKKNAWPRRWAQAMPPPDAAWVHGLVQSLLLKVTGNLHLHHHQYSFTKIHFYLWAKQMIYYPPKKGTSSKKAWITTSRWTLGSFLLKGTETWLCYVSRLEQRGCWESQIVLATVVKPIHLVRGVMASDPVYLCDQGKFIHAPFSGWVNKILQDSVICGHKQCQVNQ